MLKKILVLVCIILNLSLTVLADYKPIPKQFKHQYKKEVEQTIKLEIPKLKRQIDNIEIELNNETNLVIKQTILDKGITSILFEFYSSLVDTTNKYIKIKNDIPSTDWYIELKEFINPYLIDNKISNRQINSFLNYAEKKQKYLEKKYSN